MIEDRYAARLDALDAVWRRWADIGAALGADGWAAPSRCAGWDVAALFVHVAMFPAAMEHPPAPDPAAPASTVTAAEILRGFNRPGGVAHTAADGVAHGTVAAAAGRGPAQLVEPFAVIAPRALAAARARDPAGRVPWPGVDHPTTWLEAARIVLMESVVHLLDVLDALDRPRDVPADGLRDTAALLAEIADPATFVEAATGRSPDSPLPVLR